MYLKHPYATLTLSFYFMEPQFKTSFIPKQSLQEEVSHSSVRKKRSFGGGFSFGSLVSTVVFLAALGASAGLFLYEQYLDRSIVDKQQTLERAREAFQPALIRELQRLDNRITAAQNILDRHIAPSSIFGVLEGSTLQTVAYTEFSYKGEPSGAISLTMKGSARDFASVALQTDAYSEDPFIKDPVVSDIAVSDAGTVTFSFKGSADAQIVSFRNNLDIYQNLGLKGRSAPLFGSALSFTSEDQL